MLFHNLVKDGSFQEHKGVVFNKSVGSLRPWPEIQTHITQDQTLPIPFPSRWKPSASTSSKRSNSSRTYVLIVEDIHFPPLNSLGTPQVVLVIKILPANARDVRDTGSIPGSGRSPRDGNGNLLQYSYLGNPMDRGAWWASIGLQRVGHDWVTEHTNSLESPHLRYNCYCSSSLGPTALYLQEQMREPVYEVCGAAKPFMKC